MMTKYLKAALAFLGVVITNGLADLQSGSVLPHTGWDWLRFIGTTVVTTGIVYFSRNKLTLAQVEKAVQVAEVSVPELQSLLKKWGVSTLFAPGSKLPPTPPVTPPAG